MASSRMTKLNNGQSSKKYQSGSLGGFMDANVKIRPSELLKQSSVDVVAEDYPMIVEFVNIQDNTTQVHSAVDIDQPLFQPSPVVVVFEEYAPFAVHEKKLFFRNNDRVPRRIKILQPDSPFFEISAPRNVSGEALRQSKIAAGMEIYFIVKFKPQEVRDYSLDLMCVTEREKFLVPVRAVGSRPKMNFPDYLHFGSCPVKSTSRKMVLVQNVGTSVAKFKMRSNNAAFSCASDDMVVEPGASQMIEIFFTPINALDISADIEIEYSKNMKCFIALSGSGKNVDVSLSTPSLALEPAYISLSTQKTLRINNLSDIPIKFAWKSFPTLEEEDNEKERLHSEISRMEKLEQAALREGIFTYDHNRASNFHGVREENDNDSEGSLSGDEADLPFEARAAQASLVRKYRNLRRALEKDSMLFVDDIFDISPCVGEVWPKSEIEITCTFRPDTAAQYTCVSYLDISGREDRLNLTLSGQGIGPHAALSFDILDLGDVFVNSEQQYELSIANKGDIPAQWGFISSLTRFGNKFSFSPMEGNLDVGQSQPVKLKFCSDILGEFSEYFRFGLQGNEETLMCQVKGNVIGPTFHFDCKSIEFGAVSFDYLHSTTVRLVNTSKISMTYYLHVPQDGTLQKKEFNLTPARGTLKSGDEMDILVEFIPSTVKVYAYSLAVDVQNVGEMLLSIPISAECFSSSLSLKERDIQYGNCFIRHPYSRELTFINNSDIVHTKFTVLPQHHYTKTIASYEAIPPYGVVPPGGQMSILVNLTPEKLGNTKVPIMVSIAGSQEPPIQAALVCTAIGPRVLVDKMEIRWGNMECLKDSPRILKITNDSLINAEIKLFLKNMRSKFDLSIREATLKPQETLDLVVTANLDDTVVHNEELHIFVMEGENLMIPLSARGIGTTMFCSLDITVIDFGVQLTNTTFERRITLENKGRRHQALRWTNQTIKDENYSRSSKVKKLGREAAAGFRIPKNLLPLDPQFSVTPADITLRPRTAVTFSFKGSSSHIGHIEEVFVLESRVGKERDMKQIMTANVHCDVVDPLLDFSERDLSFIYTWEEDQPMQQRYQKEVVLTNNSLVPLNFVLKTEVPFNLSSWEHNLAPGQSVEVGVEFLPFYKDDKTSHTVEKHLQVTYRGHPQKDSIILHGEVNYPNIEFEQTSVNFGCVLNETTKTIRVKATNWSKVNAAYQWYFLEDDQSKALRPKKKKDVGSLPASQVFDILPIRSVLRPGEGEDMEFVMYGHENNKFSGKAICVVKGGPEYTITLAGEASTVSFSLDRNVIDFGRVLYNEKKDEELGIINQGLVAFNFEVATEDLSSPGIIEVIPSSGKVPPGERFKVILRIRPWCPEPIAEYIVIKAAHFDPVRLMCYCQGIFPAIVATLPRQKKVGPFGETKDIDASWKQFVATARQNVLHPDKSKLMPDLSTLPPCPSASTAVPPVYVPPVDPQDYEEGDDILRQDSYGKIREPSQVQVEVELQRLTLSHDLNAKVEELRKVSQTERAATGVSKKDGSLQMILRNVDVQTICIANYYCDFGNVILSTNKKRLFKIVNASTAGPISWMFDKRLIVGSGFSIDPEKVSRLPEGASVDFAVKFVASPKIHLGKKQIILPLTVKGAPRLNVILHATVCLPDVELSTDVLDFERVRLGCSRKMFFWLTNSSPVTAAWNMKKFLPGKDDGKFQLEPDQGTIRAGQKVIVSVEFLPSDSRKYSATITLKVDMNGKSKNLLFIGEGVAPSIRFEPSLIQLGPVLPFAEGVEKVVTVYNDSDVAVDIFSLDFDTVYKEEDMIMSAVDLYGPDNIYRSSIRLAGEPLPQQILDAYKKTLMTETKSDTAVPFEDAPIRNDGAPRDNSLQQDIIITGPPLSGVTATSKLLSAKLQLPLKTIDQIIEDVSRVSGGLGLKVRRLLKQLTPDETEYLRTLEDELLAAAEKSKVDAEALYRKEKKGKVKELPPEIFLTPQVAAHAAFLEEANFSASLFADVVRYRLTWNEMGYGVIISDIVSRYLDKEMIIEGLKAGIPNAIIARLSVTGGEAGYVSYLSNIHATKTALVNRIKAIFKAEESASRANSPNKLNSSKSKHPLIVEDTKSTVPSRKELLGDEFWFDQKTGAVTELEGDELRTIEEDQRELYRTLLKKQQQEQLAAAELFLKTLNKVWSKSTGLRRDRSEFKMSSTRPNSPEVGGLGAVEEEELSQDRMSTYWEFMNKVLPALEVYFGAGDSESLSLEHGFEQREEDKEKGGASVSGSVPMSPRGSNAGDAGESVQSTVTPDHGIFLIEFGVEDTPESIFATMMALLPTPKAPPPDKDALPLPRSFQIIRKPYPRLDRKPIERFELVIPSEERPKTAPSPVPTKASAKPGKRTGSSGASKDSKSRQQQQQVQEVVEAPPVETKPKYRWVIPPLGNISFKIRFASVIEGSFDATMTFEVTGSYQSYNLLCLGSCEVPQINSDPRNTFMRRVKALSAGAPPPLRRFVTSENYFSFGPLLKFKQSEWRGDITADSTAADRIHRDLVLSNVDVFRISNSGRYKCTVDLGFEEPQEEGKEVFYVEPQMVELEEGETKEVKLWAFPSACKEFKNNLVACISNNPKPILFDIRCVGVEPEVELEGPWSESVAAMKKAMAETKDPKKFKELELKLASMIEVSVLDFDRLLVGKADIRTFEVKNTSLLPVAWEIDPLDFLDSQNVSITPTSGTLTTGASVTVSATFTSQNILLLEGKFVFKFSDAEGGLQSGDRVKYRSIMITAEAYQIQAVTLTADGQEESGNEVDFGLLKVGDYATQFIRMGNKGKYKIGYKFSFRRPSTAALVSIEPMDGTIDAKGEAEVKLTFCAKNSEMKLTGNRDIRAHISEPITGEVVEEFPILISALVKYNRFRMQPSKGISFGAVRFDSDIRTKRIEFKNEGQFEITYVVTASSSEQNELDALDSQALGCYAYNTPAALRAIELGEGYLGRISTSRPGSKQVSSRPVSKQTKTAAKPSKKDPKATTGKLPEPVKDSVVGNPLIRDPDNLQPGVIPTDPLVVGAFTAFPRVGYVQPGESAGIDVTFNPLGCDSAREKLKFFITGVDVNDLPAQLAKAFEVVGDSCFPAIVVDDVRSIFEEQEVVSSLSDIVSGSVPSSGGGQGSTKIEKLAAGKVVFAQQEKMLAFGPVVCGAGQGRGAVERVRITNPTKIDTKVKFKCLLPEVAAAESAAANAPPQSTAKGNGKAGGKDAKSAKPKAAPKPHKTEVATEPPSDSSGFTVHPETWDIPPHEHRFVNIFFNPTEIKSYRAVFIAEVDEEESPIPDDSSVHRVGGKRLTFDLGGSGTMPCISIETPTERDDLGHLLLQFSKVHIGRTSRKKLTIRNDGVMSATCLFDMSGEEAFKFQSKGSSVSLNPGEKRDLMVEYCPTEVIGTGVQEGQIKVTVLNNMFDHYTLKLHASTYACDAVIDTNNGQQKRTAATANNNGSNPDGTAADSAFSEGTDKAQEEISFDHVNLAEGLKTCHQVILLKSRSDHTVRFEFTIDSTGGDVISFSPKVGHLGPSNTREISVTFSPREEIKLDGIKITCTMKRITYTNIAESEAADVSWDDSMKTVRPATQADLDRIENDEKLMAEYRAKASPEKDKSKAKKLGGKAASVLPPQMSGLQLAPHSMGGMQMVLETSPEPAYTYVANAEAQSLSIRCNAVADVAKFKCDIPNGQIPFKTTFLFQSTVYSFPFKNESNVNLPVRWFLENIKRKPTPRPGTTPASRMLMSRMSSALLNNSAIACPFKVDPEEFTVPPLGTQLFTVKFQPTEVDDFVYLLRGETAMMSAAATAALNSPSDDFDGASAVGGNTLRAVVRGASKRPICHIDILDSPDYLTRRLPNMKNENGVNSPIECSDIRVVELESTGLRSRNTFRFFVINPTSENYEFLWEPLGDPCPSWRCALNAGILYSGKRVEMIFEYLPEDMAVAESFYKFRLPTVGLDQIFLFAGRVTEPKVSFSIAKIDFQRVMLGGEGNTEIIYIENQEHLPFNFAFDRMVLSQLEGPSGPVLDIMPKSGNIAPHSKVPITFSFKPQEEIVYNFNIQCEVKRKPNKLSLNIKGEGYAVHPTIQLEQMDISSSGTAGTHFVPLRPHPAVNFADFGAVQVLDTVSKKIIIGNAGKYNFDYIWETDSMGGMLSLSGGKFGGTLQKGNEMSFLLSFSPQREAALDGAVLSFTVAGKYTYNIFAKGSGVKPALRFSFMQFDFGPCYITSPGGNVVVEETTLRIVNHDPTNNISIECTFQKTRALWAECQPTVLDPGASLDVVIRFAPRDIKDYTFILPFVVNGTGKVSVTITGRGINARLELANQSQRRVNFGLVNVNSEVTRTVVLVNRSRKALPVQLIDDGVYGSGVLHSRCVAVSPFAPFTIAPKESVPIILSFNPTRRIPQFSEDLNVYYAGVTRKLLTVSGKAQGYEVSLDTDSLPFGTVVLDSQKVKKLSLDNAGDMSISFEWVQSSFGSHFSISPLSGKLAPGTEISFDVVFRPKFVDADVRQEGVTLLIPGLSPLTLTCSGVCISQPSDSIQVMKFESFARKAQEKSIKLANPTDKDWYISPALEGGHWRVPHECKVPAKGAANLNVTYFPLTMAPKASLGATGDLSKRPNCHTGKLFIAMPDGTAIQYNLEGNAEPPECSGTITVETPAKKPINMLLRLENWLSDPQTFKTTVEVTEKPSAATFIVAANAVEVGPNGTKDFPVRFQSYVEGLSKVTVTFTNPITNEYCFYNIIARSTTTDVLETISMESPIRQTARYIITAENPLPRDVTVTMGSPTKSDEWWTCDSNVVRMRELIPFSGNSEGSFEVEFRPLVATSHPKEHLLTIMSKDLGTFKYKLCVTTTPPSLRQTLRFDVPLGSVQTENFVFRAFNTTPCTFNCSVRQSDFFSVPKTINVDATRDWDGADVKVAVSFEPTEIGEVSDTLSLLSSEGGEYHCEVIGCCTAPIPQGPINFSEGGGPVEIPFRNCFNSSCRWVFSVDSPCFKLPVSSATIAAKSKGVCNVIFEPTHEAMSSSAGLIAAKLFIKCDSKPELPPWVYYIKGKVESRGSAGGGGGYNDDDASMNSALKKKITGAK